MKGGDVRPRLWRSGRKKLFIVLFCYEVHKHDVFRTGLQLVIINILVSHYNWYCIINQSVTW
jgi:hypothetical protein